MRPADFAAPYVDWPASDHRSVSVAHTAMFVCCVSLGLCQFFPTALVAIFSYVFLKPNDRPGHKAKICIFCQPQISKINLGNFWDTSKKNWEFVETVSFSQRNSRGLWIPGERAQLALERGKLMPFFSLGTDRFGLPHQWHIEVFYGCSKMVKAYCYVLYLLHFITITIFAGMVTWTFINRYFDVRRVPGYRAVLFEGFRCQAWWSFFQLESSCYVLLGKVRGMVVKSMGWCFPGKLISSLSVRFAVRDTILQPPHCDHDLNRPCPLAVACFCAWAAG